MSTLLEDRPLLVEPREEADAQSRPAFDFPQLPIAEKPPEIFNELEAPLQGFGRGMTRAYMSSFNLCLNELGWVPKRILEVGCGNGSLLSYIGQTFMDAEVVGITFGPRSAEQARSKTCCRIHFEEADAAERLPFKDDDFDLVIAHGWLADTPMPHHWVREITRVSAEGVILSALHPTAERWTRWMPGAKSARLAGQAVFEPGRGAIPMSRLQHWLNESGCQVEVRTHPLPFTMMMARKPQIQQVAV